MDEGSIKPCSTLSCAHLPRHHDVSPARLGRITMPVMNVYAKDDHIIPPATSRALGSKLGSSDYEELALPGGHVGMFVGGKSQTLFDPAVAAFLARHDGSGHPG